MKQRILVVDSDAACRDALRTGLQSSGFDVAVLYEPGRANGYVFRPDVGDRSRGRTGCRSAALPPAATRIDEREVYR
ncbi:hypothetical protein CUJ89_33395 [Burkholderia pyrrocinia]|uniref:Uncharacterized protein n=1 Tax=Burkholderia pyrrocinia TaxID=60550 RepID=A0A2Z5N727_BURPY|nr:hypothetical protein [Burkholderia pyrrocinia]AXF25381.1 hypothetical protein CUJ89_33395 [Burkholderia pyrrocinia]